MRTNVHVPQPPVFTHEGGPASRNVSAAAQLRRSVMACLLWEDTFYEDGEDIAKRIQEAVSKCSPTDCMNIAIEARTDFKLRHVPLLIAAEMARLPEHKILVSHTVEQIIQRPDEITELLSIIAKINGVPPSAVKKHIAKGVQKGIASAFRKFNEYSLAKYNGGKTAIKLRDALFLSHSKPLDAPEKKYTKDERKIKPRIRLNEHEALYKRLVDGELATPDTWEVALSGGADKKETFERLIAENKLGALALLRNLRNMQESGVDKKLVAVALDMMDTERVLPYRFIAAANAVPQWEDIIEPPMLRCMEGIEKLPGKTVVYVDISGSMCGARVSQRSDIDRLDAACGVAIMAREICEDVEICRFESTLSKVPPRRGFALRDTIRKGAGGGTYLGNCLQQYGNFKGARVIVITDEQTADNINTPKHYGASTGYIINVAAYKNGIGYDRWIKIDGWSEAVLNYVAMSEKE